MSFRSTLSLATALVLACAPCALAAAPFQLAAADGVDFRDQEYTLKASSRTGHAEYTAEDYKAALKALPKDQRIAVRSIMGKLDATTRQQLEALIAFNRVQYKDATGHTLIDNLWTLVDKKLKHGIKNETLLTEIIRDVGRPTTIGQANHGTCTATSAQSALARSAPAEYARVLGGLAGGDGVVTLRDGKTKLDSSLYIPYEDRTVTGNLFQPACMDAQARHSGSRYDNKIDKNITKSGKQYGGSYITDLAAIQTAMLVGKYESEYVEGAKKKRIVAILEGATPRSPVLLCLNTAGGGAHEVQCVGWDAKKKVYKIRNPWGETVFVPKADVREHLSGLNYRVE